MVVSLIPSPKSQVYLRYPYAAWNSASTGLQIPSLLAIKAVSGLEKTVTCMEGDALKTLPTLEGKFDFMFIDAVKRDYLKYFKLVESKLSPGAVIVGDNVIRSAKAMEDFLDYVQQSPNYDTVIIRASMEKGDGMSISYKIK